ncbi:hypothetical protein D3C84_917550 [compost metagenome]
MHTFLTFVNTIVESADSGSKTANYSTDTTKGHQATHCTKSAGALRVSGVLVCLPLLLTRHLPLKLLIFLSLVGGFVGVRLL